MCFSFKATAMFKFDPHHERYLIQNRDDTTPSVAECTFLHEPLHLTPPFPPPLPRLSTLLIFSPSLSLCDDLQGIGEREYYHSVAKEIAAHAMAANASYLGGGNKQWVAKDTKAGTEKGSTEEASNESNKAFSKCSLQAANFSRRTFQVVDVAARRAAH